MFQFLTNSIFFLQNEIILWGHKHAALFQTYNSEKSSFFNALKHIFAQIYAKTWQGGHLCLHLGQIGLKKGEQFLNNLTNCCRQRQPFELH